MWQYYDDDGRSLAPVGRPSSPGFARLPPPPKQTYSNWFSQNDFTVVYDPVGEQLEQIQEAKKILESLGFDMKAASRLVSRLLNDRAEMNGRRLLEIVKAFNQLDWNDNTILEYLDASDKEDWRGQNISDEAANATLERLVGFRENTKMRPTTSRFKKSAKRRYRQQTHIESDIYAMSSDED